jgi:HTH-type transcriptional regulator/antitoxin HigA
VKEEMIPARPVPPGAVLRRELEVRGWTQKDLAEVIGRPQQVVCEIMRGAKQITAQTALELSAALGTPPELWLSLEANYRLALAQPLPSREDIVRRSRVYDLAPVAELLKRGWIRPPISVEDLEVQVRTFLDVPSPVARMSVTTHLPRCPSERPAGSAVAAWIRGVERAAESRTVEGFAPDVVRDSVSDLLRLSVDVEAIRTLPGRLAAMGIRFVVVPHLSSAPVDGASLLRTGGPVIALTLRRDRLDVFWFVLMHELAHVLSGKGRGYVCRPVGTGPDTAGETAVEEAAANRQADDWLIPPQAYREFVSGKGTRPTKSEVISFATAVARHPGIVLGRLQRDGHLRAGAMAPLNPPVSRLLREAVEA